VEHGEGGEHRREREEREKAERTYVRLVDRSEIEYLRRSLAMLPPQAAGLSREEAMRLLAQLQETDKWLRELREGLTTLLDRASPDAQG
jgi:hypothetical protein